MVGDRDLEPRVHRALRALPLPAAPPTLLPWLMAIVGRPWYARAWLTWPRVAQAASIVGLVGVLAGLAFVATSAESLVTASTVARIGWRWLVAPVVAYAFVMAVALSVAVSASWAALTRVALGGSTE
jgi:hypothetical protein